MSDVKDPFVRQTADDVHLVVQKIGALGFRTGMYANLTTPGFLTCVCFAGDGERRRYFTVSYSHLKETCINLISKSQSIKEIIDVKVSGNIEITLMLDELIAGKYLGAERLLGLQHINMMMLDETEVPIIGS